MTVASPTCSTSHPRRLPSSSHGQKRLTTKNAAHNISALSGFFKWANRHGYRRSSCPVVTKFHGERRPHYLPRPYTAEDLGLIWRLADERGNNRIRAVLAIGEQAGLRLGEIFRLREQDVDLEGRGVISQQKPTCRYLTHGVPRPL